MDYKKRVEVKCINCDEKWLKRFDSLPSWNKRCRSCSQKIINSTPEKRENARRLGHKMMIKFNNHIPNAKKFTSEDVSGPKSNFWKGGITPINQKIRTSQEYKDWRTSVFERDNYTCKECGSRGYTLNADHIKPFAYYPELRLSIDNGRTLCVPCHKKTDTYAGRGVKRMKLTDTANWNVT